MKRDVCIGLLLILVAAVTLQAGITFSGVNGAVAWTWVEGENYTSSSDASNQVAGLGSISGYSASLPANEVSITGYATWNVNLPMAMDNAKMYAHCSSYYVDGSWRSFDILRGGSNGSVVGTIYSGEGNEGWKDAVYWAKNGGELGTLAQGSTQMTIKQNVYNIMMFDGFFLTDGTIDLSSNVPSTASNSAGQCWMKAPTFASLPTLNETVTWGVNGATSGERYFINGSEVTGSSFVLDQSGTYYLEVRDFDGVKSLMGVAFNLSVPEPATLLFLLSSFGLIWQRKNNK